MPDDKNFNTVDDGEEGLEDLSSYLGAIAAILESILEGKIN